MASLCAGVLYEKASCTLDSGTLLGGGSMEQGQTSQALGLTSHSALRGQSGPYRGLRAEQSSGWADAGQQWLVLSIAKFM